MAEATESRRLLVTGGSGFVGRHLVDRLQALGRGPIAPDRSELDLLDPTGVGRFVEAHKPSAIFHLAALASVAASWEAPAETILKNVSMALNVLEAVRASCPDAAILLASSGEVYGVPESLPVSERAPLRPQNPYAVSKAACDLLARQYGDAHGLRVVVTRAFNHAGPGQSESYVLGSLTRQVAEAEVLGRTAVTLSVGALDVARDFTDVRDVVRAYIAAADLDPGVYNVCSGRAWTVRSLIEMLKARTRLEVRVSTDPSRLRPTDPTEIRGSLQELRAATGWTPTMPIDRTLQDAIDAWRGQFEREPPRPAPGPVSAGGSSRR